MWADTESENDYLNFSEVSQLVVEILSSKGMLPVSVGIFGNWGAGKSSLLRLLQKQIREEHEDWIVIQFDAWLYQGYDDARAALLEVIATELTQATKDNPNLLQKAKNLLARVNWFRTLGFTGEGVAMLSGIPTGGMFLRGTTAIEGLADGIQSEEEYAALKQTGQDAKTKIAGLVKPKESKSPPQQIAAFRKEYSEILDGLGKPLVVIIDNLDRCLPANAIHTLEAIRLFLFLTNTAFVLSADEDMIRSSVAEHFKGSSDRHQIDYIDKLIQIPIRVPKAGIHEVRSYLFMLYAIDQGISAEPLECLRTGLEKALQNSWKEDPISRQNALALTGEEEDSNLGKAYERVDRIAPVLANSPIIHGNPRIVKRLLNVVKMRSSIARRRSMPLDEAIITKLVIFERCAGAEATADFYRLVDAEQGKPLILKELEAEDNTKLPKTAPESWTKNPTTGEFIKQWSNLDPKLSDIDLRAAIYLSRETMPIGSYVVGLSPSGRESLEALAIIKNIASPAAQKILETLPFNEQVPVMEGLIDKLRGVSDWANQPIGFSGCCLLAQHSSEAAKVFVRFISNIDFGDKQPPWMQALLKDKVWYKGK